MDDPDPRHSELDLAILQTLESNAQPVGSGTLHYLLRHRGDTRSAPTIGRKLRDLEERGLVAKVSVEGRVLTDAGQALLRKAAQARQLETSGEKLLGLLKRGGRKDIVDQLTTRRLIEGETAALAALHATPEQIELLEQSIQQGHGLVGKGETGVPADVDFHDTIAEASGNKVLAAMVVMLRSQAWLNEVVASIRAKVGGQLVVDHETIVAAIKSHAPDQARKAMEQHLDKLILDVERYWAQAFPQADSD